MVLWLPDYAVTELIQTINWSILGFSIALSVIIIGIRLHLLRNTRIEQQFLETWQPMFDTCLSRALPDWLPTLNPEHVTLFLKHWLQYQELADETVRENLNLVAYQAGIQNHLLDLLDARSVKKRLLALTAIGFLDERDYWESCYTHLWSPSPFVSLMAARSLLQLNRERAIPIILQALGQFNHWPKARTILILIETGIDHISMPLCDTIAQAEETVALKLIPYLEIAHQHDVSTLLCWLLHQSPSEAMSLACLKMARKFSQFEELSLVRGFLSHPNALIRAEAAITLSVLSPPEEEWDLLDLLHDQDPHVRQEVARVLVQSDEFNEDSLKLLDALELDDSTSLWLTKAFIEKQCQL